MAGIDVPSADPLTFFRREISPREQAIAQAQWEAHKKVEDTQQMVALGLLALLVLVVLAGIAMKRREIGRALDRATVSGLASGLRTSRKAASGMGNFWNRVRSKADETSARS